ncbi:ZNF22 protein, partial [Alectura lathami]|nr:ZNF22 protein [Alectura lathami]
MADPVKSCESSSSQLTWPQSEEPSQKEAGESRESEIKYCLLSVKDHRVLQELVVDRLEEQVKNHEQEGLGHTEELKVLSEGQRENIFQNDGLGCQKGEKSQNTSLKITFEKKQAVVSRKRCYDVRDFQDNVIAGRASLGQTPYQCTVCSRNFSLNLLQHQRTHTTTKPHQCMQCGKIFTCKATPIQHREVHWRQSTFECSECGDHFRFSSSLTLHLKTHKGEKHPYLCPQCGQCFCNASELV